MGAEMQCFNWFMEELVLEVDGYSEHPVYQMN
jgi:hypothetical protein